MKKCRLISFTDKTQIHKGESYLMCFLKFEIIIFSFFKYYKTIRYDLTMFDTWKDYKANWEMMIKYKSLVKYSIIKDRIIFK